MRLLVLFHFFGFCSYSSLAKDRCWPCRQDVCLHALDGAYVCQPLEEATIHPGHLQGCFPKPFFHMQYRRQPTCISAVEEFTHIPCTSQDTYLPC